MKQTALIDTVYKFGLLWQRKLLAAEVCSHRKYSEQVWAESLHGRGASLGNQGNVAYWIIWLTFLVIFGSHWKGRALFEGQRCNSRALSYFLLLCTKKGGGGGGFRCLKFRDAEYLQLLWLSLGAVDSWALGCLVCMLDLGVLCCHSHLSLSGSSYLTCCIYCKRFIIFPHKKQQPLVLVCRVWHIEVSCP